jgi:hypothetical protein
MKADMRYIDPCVFSRLQDGSAFSNIDLCIIDLNCRHDAYLIGADL